MNAASLPELWANCVDSLKDRVNNRSFWEALEHTYPITIENDTLIIGMEPENFNRAGHIQQTSNMHTVTKTVEEIFNHPFQVRLIEGNTLSDWEAVKERDARVAAMREATSAPRPVTPSAPQANSWDAIYEQLARLYAQSEHRSMPQGKSHYVNEALYLLVEAMDTLYPDQPDEATERNLARAIERIANSAEMPPTVVAFELDRLRAWRKAEAG